MPSGILFLKVSDLFGKSEFANPLSDFYLSKMGCRIPIRQMPSGILLFKGLRHYWQRKNLPTHYRTSTLRLYIFTITFSGECLHCFTKRNLYYRIWRITRTWHKEICIAIEFLLSLFFFRQSPKSKKGLPAALCLRKKRE